MIYAAVPNSPTRVACTPLAIRRDGLLILELADDCTQKIVRPLEELRADSGFREVLATIVERMDAGAFWVEGEYVGCEATTVGAGQGQGEGGKVVVG